MYINIPGKGWRGGIKSSGGSPSLLPEGEGIRRKGKEEGKVAGCKTFSYSLSSFLSSIFPLSFSLSSCCSRVRAVCPACLRRKHRSEGLAPRWWKPDITAALAAPLDTLPEQGGSWQHTRRSSLCGSWKANFLFPSVFSLSFFLPVFLPFRPLLFSAPSAIGQSENVSPGSTM